MARIPAVKMSQWRKTLRNNMQRKLEDIMRKHRDVFSDDMGKMNTFKAKLHLKHTAQPKFMKYRSVRYAIRPKVETELDRLEQEGIIKKVEFSDWATQ